MVARLARWLFFERRVARRIRHTPAMDSLRRWIGALIRKMTAVEPVRDEQPGEGPVAPDVLRNLPPGGGAPGS
jgi:hypothetical protein